MKITPALCSIFLVLSPPVFAQSAGEKTGVNSLLGVSPSTADFVHEAAVSDMFEIQASRLAAEKAEGATKTFASQMVRDHQKTSDELKSLVKGGTVKAEIPAAMSSSLQKKLDTLKSLNGADFDKQYRADQVKAHEDAVSLFQRYAKGGDSAPLKEWAAKTLPALEHHLKMAQEMNR